MRTNVAVKSEPIFTHGGSPAQAIDAYRELQRSVLTCLLWENSYYEEASGIAARIAELVPKVDPAKVAMLASEARNRMQLRHAPLFLISELSKIKGTGPLIEDALADVVQRADELGEFLSIYWKYGAREGAKKTSNGKHPLSAGIKRGLARAFQKFSAYSLAKYNRDDGIKLRDVLFLVNAKPKDDEQAAIWKKLVDKTLESPDTWEVELSAGKDKKTTFERLLTEGKLGGLAVLRNLRNMQGAGVNDAMIKARLRDGIQRALPFRFIAAAQHAPKLEADIEAAMLIGLAQQPKLSGRTLLVIDTSGSMGGRISAKSEIDRLGAACGVAILAREVCEDATIYATAGNDMTRKHATMEIPSRRGFALRDAITGARSTIGGGGIFLVQCMDFIAAKEPREFDRVIVFTDEQDCDTGGNKPENAKRLGRNCYVVNVSVEKNGISYRNGWEHIDGFSEAVIDYIREIEFQSADLQAPDAGQSQN